MIVPDSPVDSVLRALEIRLPAPFGRLVRPGRGFPSHAGMLLEEPLLIEADSNSGPSPLPPQLASVQTDPKQGRFADSWCISYAMRRTGAGGVPAVRDELLDRSAPVAASLVRPAVDEGYPIQDPGFFLDFTWSSRMLDWMLRFGRPIRGELPLVIVDDSVWDLDRCLTILSDRRESAGGGRLNHSSISAYQPHELDRILDDFHQAARVGTRLAPIGMNNIVAIRRLIGQGLIDYFLLSPEQAASRVFAELVRSSPVAVSSRSSEKLPGSAGMHAVFSSDAPFRDLAALLDGHGR